VSNRVVVPGRESGGQAGGLAVAIHPLLRRYPGIWFGWSGQVAAKPTIRTIQRGHQSYVLTDLLEEDYQEYYNGYANEVLWPILHYRLDLAEFYRRDLGGYMRVNQTFATELDKLLRPDDVLWIHDYHLFPLAKRSARAAIETRSGFFTIFPFHHQKS
jgi:trehalose 6-phosphate synthase